MGTMEHNSNPQFSKAHLATLNRNNFKMIEAMGLKIEWHYLPTKFNESLPCGSKVISRGHIDRQTQIGDTISLLSFLEMLYHHCFSTLLWNMPSEGSKRTRRD
jgi:hypothetical protein